MFQHFSELAKDISTVARDYVVKLSKTKIPGVGFGPRGLVYNKFFRVPINVQNCNNRWFMHRFNDFLKTKDILSFSFVRHPFER